MRWLSDNAVARLRAADDLPETTGTRYRVLEGAARGGMGAVYLAEDILLGRRVALKVLDLPDPTGELAARMLREAQIVARLEHPGIVPVHDVGRMADGRVFYAMKFIRGRRLDEHISSSTMLADRLGIFQKICDAVAFAHSLGVLHRDLKPQNIMVGPFGEVLVMDWGVAKVFREFAGPSEQNGDSRPQDGPSRSVGSLPASASLDGTEHGAILGTPGYMAPEQARGEIERLDERTDVYALGAILQFLLTGRAPDAASTDASTGIPSGSLTARFSRSLNAIPPVAAISATAMAHDPAGRYASAQELSADVARYLDGLPVMAYPESVLAKAQRVVSRHRVAVLLILAYLLTRVLLLGLLGR